MKNIRDLVLYSQKSLVPTSDGDWVPRSLPIPDYVYSHAWKFTRRAVWRTIDNSLKYSIEDITHQKAAAEETE